MVCVRKLLVFAVLWGPFAASVAYSLCWLVSPDQVKDITFVWFLILICLVLVTSIAGFVIKRTEYKLFARRIFCVSFLSIVAILEVYGLAYEILWQLFEVWGVIWVCIFFLPRHHNNLRKCGEKPEPPPTKNQLPPQR